MLPYFKSYFIFFKKKIWNSLEITCMNIKKCDTNQKHKMQIKVISMCWNITITLPKMMFNIHSFFYSLNFFFYTFYFFSKLCEMNARKTKQNEKITEKKTITCCYYYLKLWYFFWILILLFFLSFFFTLWFARYLAIFRYNFFFFGDAY